MSSRCDQIIRLIDEALAAAELAGNAGAEPQKRSTPVDSELWPVRHARTDRPWRRIDAANRDGCGWSVRVPERSAQ